MKSTYEKRSFIVDDVLECTWSPSAEPDYGSLGEGILDNLNKDRDLVGLIDCTTGDEYTCGEMREMSVRSALWMKSQGLLDEEVVMICTGNRMEAAIPCFGALYLGAAYNPLDIEAELSDFRHMMSITRPKIAFVDEEKAGIVARAAEEVGLLVRIVVFGYREGFASFDNVLASSDAREVDDFEPKTLIDGSDRTAAILSTSGSTGLPKGVSLSDSALLKQLAPGNHDWIDSKNALVFAPISWLVDTFYVLLTVFERTTRYLPPAFDESTFCDIIEKHGLSYAFMGASMVNRLLESGALRNRESSSLVDIVCGGTLLAVDSQLALKKLLPNTRLRISYGITEAGGVVTCQTASNSKLGSCGILQRPSRLKVVDLKTGEILGPGKTGEIFITTNTLMNGYFNDPVATAGAIDAEGWLRSGDLGYYDDDGELYIVDRLKEMIKYRDCHVSPVEIENLLNSHPGVKEAAVLGVPHPIDDQHPVALVVRKENSSGIDGPTEEQLIKFVAERVSDSKRLRGGVIFLDHDLPKNSLGKIKRFRIKKLFAESTAIVSKG